MHVLKEWPRQGLHCCVQVYGGVQYFPDTAFTPASIENLQYTTVRPADQQAHEPATSAQAVTNLGLSLPIVLLSIPVDICCQFTSTLTVGSACRCHAVCP